MKKSASEAPSMEKLHHNGVLVPPRYEGRGLKVRVNGRGLELTPEQEEMAVAWAKKIGTPYVEDPEFAKNFHKDFSSKLGFEVKPGEVDFSEVLRAVEEERAFKAGLSREERKRQAAERKEKREENKEHYGYAWADGVRIEVGNYTVEPNCIFMGRGKHPRRGSWKEGPMEVDIELNLSPDAEAIRARLSALGFRAVWDPNSIWIARWKDKLSGKMKYVWPSDSSPIKQRKDIEKFEKARELEHYLTKIQRHILANLDADDPKRRKIATVCYLIDALKIRVGDEKDEEEADTVGASTLRAEHVCFNEDKTVTFDFLGKDSVRNVITVDLPKPVRINLEEFGRDSPEALFDGVDSARVSDFLDEVMTGLSSKVFRTFYASKAVESRLAKIPVGSRDPEYVKRHAVLLANLEAAEVCNHKRTIPKSWGSSLERKKARLETLKRRAKTSEERLKQREKELGARLRDKLRALEERLKKQGEMLETLQQQIVEKKNLGKPLEQIMKHVRLRSQAVKGIELLMKSTKDKHAEQSKNLKEQLKKMRRRNREAVERLELQIEEQKATRDFNLGTSLKSYIDPRIYYNWGKGIGFDWKKYYPTTLQKKFSWVETEKTSLREKY